jgi:hypothetical protein
MLLELRKVIPSFLQRVDRPERGGEWAAYLAATRQGTDDLVQRLWPDAKSPGGEEEPDRPLVRLMDWDPDGERKVLAAMCFPHTSLPEDELLRRVGALGAEDQLALARAYIGSRSNRRHRPGRALERTQYRFEVVSDYGAFRDLQRHRMLTIEWQRLDPSLGFEIPALVAEAGIAPSYEESLSRSAALHEVMIGPFPEQACYAVALAFRIRYAMQMNAREAMHLVELRSGQQGHPVYRRVAQEMHRLIGERAGHRVLADAMRFVDYADHDLERLDAERRSAERRAAAHRG